MLTLLTAYARTNELKVIDAVDSPLEALGLLGTITNWVFALLLTVAVIYVLLAAFEYLTSKGGEGVEKAHKMLIYAAVAIAVAVLAKGFVSIAANIAGQERDVKFVDPSERE